MINCRFHLLEHVPLQFQLLGYRLDDHIGPSHSILQVHRGSDSGQSLIGVFSGGLAQRNRLVQHRLHPHQSLGQGFTGNIEENRLHSRLGKNLSNAVAHGPRSEDRGLIDSFDFRHGGLKS